MWYSFYMVNIMSETEKSYLAGIIDGEGSISINFRNPNKASREVGMGLTIQLTVCMSHEETIRWISKITGTEEKVYVDSPKKVEHYKQTYTWRPTIAQAYDIIEQCIPYMITKHRNAEIFLELVSIRRKSTRTERNWERQFDLATENRLINRRGVVSNS